MTSQKVKDEICCNFLGSCSSITTWHEERYNLSYEQIAEILEEGEVILCETCGWWCDLSEMEEFQGEYWCGGCLEDNEEWIT